MPPGMLLTFVALSVAAALFAKPLGEFHQSMIDIWPKPLRFWLTFGIQYDDPTIIRISRLFYGFVAVVFSTLLVLNLTKR